MSSGGALALIALWAIQRFLPNTIPTYAKIVIYVLSTLQHCVRPLKKSLLMDFVPKNGVVYGMLWTLLQDLVGVVRRFSVAG